MRGSCCAQAVEALLAGVALLIGAVAAPGLASAAPSHGLSLFGDLKYGPDFTHFDYANPAAPKGGTMRLAAIGTFDSLNPYIVKGVSAAGMSQTFDTLMLASEDEPGSEYGLVAESADLAPDRKSVLYTLRKEARFHDGSPITPDDVIWTFDTLREKGQPMYRSYYGDVEKVERRGRTRRAVLFQIGREPRIAADRRPDADPVEEVLGGARLHKDDARRAARQRSVQGRGGRSRALDHLSPRARLLGGRFAGQEGER